jgi:hypothetical protein
LKYLSLREGKITGGKRMKKIQDGSSSVLTEGIYYSNSNIENGITDLYHLKYNPNVSYLFDIKTLTDQSTDKPWNKEYLIQTLCHDKYFDPFRRLIVSYAEKKNVELLIDVIHNFYSNRSCGIRNPMMPEGPIDRMKLLVRYQKSSSHIKDKP